MEELFTILSSSARLDKRGKKKRGREAASSSSKKTIKNHAEDSDGDSDDDIINDDHDTNEAGESSRDITGKRDMSKEKREKVRKEEVAAFRRSMAIRVTNKHDPQLPDPISSFPELTAPAWWTGEESFRGVSSALLRNIEAGKWKEPTPIQMQSIPALLNRRDLIGAAPTGSGKSGAFIIPALLLSSAPFETFYGDNKVISKKKKKKTKSSREGEIRSLLLAPSRELAAQLHREVERLGLGKPGGLSSLLLTKSNSAHIIAGTAGGKRGLDVLISTPLRLIDAVEKGLRLDSVRLVVLDEADRLLDATDGKQVKNANEDSSDEEEENDSSDKEEEGDSNSKENTENEPASGSSQSQSFLSQMDRILSAVPSCAARALFSATVTSMVKSLAETILRNPIDLKIATTGSYGGANTDIEQELMFVGREDGKLLAMRQLKQRGHLKPPCIVFMQSQERAQALFAELLYEGMHVDVIHAGRSKTARDNAVAKFRKGDTWVLICTDLVSRGVDFRAVNMVINYDLPASGITYVHRIGRTGRAGRKGKAITLFTEADFDNLRTIANVMKQSGCKVEDWMLQMQKSTNMSAPRRAQIDTTPYYDKKKKHEKKEMIRQRKEKKTAESQQG
jgi:ATP-dependent RNA helicase DDX52/ROK1